MEIARDQGMQQGKAEFIVKHSTHAETVAVRPVPVHCSLSYVVRVALAQVPVTVWAPPIPLLMHLARSMAPALKPLPLQSVVVKVPDPASSSQNAQDQNVYLFAKGSFEKIAARCRPETLPTLIRRGCGITNHQTRVLAPGCISKSRPSRHSGRTCTYVATLSSWGSTIARRAFHW